MKKGNQKYFLLALVIITMIGCGLRGIFCFWGYPYQLHPDEHTIVENALDMLRRHSWEAYVYNRPDQFEIKCNALIFNVVSWLKWGFPAYDIADNVTKAPFYLMARLYTAMFGTAMIPMMYLVVGKIFDSIKIDKIRWIQIFSATLVAFSPIFIEHSGYATPDIVFSFFVLLISYFSVLYLESDGKKWIYWIAGVTGICISIKYPAAIICVYIAFIVIYKCIRQKKKFSEIVLQGISCILIILAVIFVIAPNLYTDFPSVVKTFISEARPNHLGQDGLSMFGNMMFYFRTISDSMGWFSILLFIFGILFLVKTRRYQYFALSISGIYWICLSILSLHWVRWGIPMFLSYIIIVAAGGVSVWERASSMSKGKRVMKVVSGTVCGLILLNAVFAGAAIAKWSSLPDARIVALKYCEEHGITVENSIYEGYSPLAMDYGTGPQYKAFEMEDGKINVKEEFKDKEYYVLSSNFMKRYLYSADQYPAEAEFYAAIDDNFELLYTVSGTDYKKSPIEVVNIFSALKYLFGDNTVTGLPIYVYAL